MTNSYIWMAMSEWIEKYPNRDFKKDGWEFVGGALRKEIMSEHYYNREKGEFDQPYFTEVVWRGLMESAYVYGVLGSPAHTECDLWNSDAGYRMRHNQRMSAEYSRAARKLMGIE